MQRHRNRPAINFWLDVAASHPTTASRAVLFPSTWKWEQEFSIFLNIKSKKRNRLVALSTIFDVQSANLLNRLSIV